MSNLYRKSLIDKMSSPEQLDKMVVITPPSFWIAILGGIIVVAAVLAWSFLGSIPEKVDASGLYVSSGDSVLVTSELNGTVDEVCVDSGDSVQEGDVLYTLDTKSLKSQKKDLKTRVEQIEDITLTSSDDAAIKEAQDLLTIKAEYKALNNNSAEASYSKAKSNAAKAKSEEKAAKKEYNKALKGDDANEIAQAQAKYEAAMSAYQQAKSTADSYGITRSSEASSVQSQRSSYKAQFTSTKGAILDQLNQQIDEYKKQIKDSSVTAETAGTAVNIGITEGSYIQQGATALVIRQEGGTAEAVCYVSVVDAKSVKAGMEVNIYPSNYDKQEYGHIIGHVKSVADTAATETEIFDKINDQTMVETLLSNGPVVAVECTLDEDADTESGFAWSSKKGETVDVAENTVISAEIITDEKKPITLLVPFLKEKFSMKTTE